MRFRTDASFRWAIAVAIILSTPAWVLADDTDGGNEPSKDSALPAPKVVRATPSLDSVIAWTDQYYFRELRIQSHVQTGRYRLLDGGDKLRAEGTFEQCRARLDEIKQEEGLPSMRGKAVILLHGLAAPRWSMKLLARHLQKNGGYHTFTIDYASLRTGIDHHASSLANVIQSLEGIEQINLVGHSMGNIVIRRYLAGNDVMPNRWKPDPRIARIVMIAPPNHGSLTATQLSGTSVFKTVFGKSGQQLGVDWEELEKRLAIPRMEFGIIAGGFGNNFGLNPFLPGDDDGRITVQTTRLAGAADFLVVPSVHELIANDPRVFEYTLRFFDEGHFVSVIEKQAIPLESLAERPGAIKR